MKKIEKQNKQSEKKGLLKDKRGLSTVEYIIILVLVAVGGIELWTKFGTTLEEKIETSNTAVGDME